ncbi:hypothetical protein MicvaDRAFT_3342 [Microcoleus vaginatus FGP-2]|nr:hypothetical protein MicvaDRAFT_3342 [Microcoleus vaginatus FGP-2]
MLRECRQLVSRVSVDRNFGHQIAGGSICAYGVWINFRSLLATHSQTIQEKISLKPPRESDCGRYLLTCLLPKLLIIRLKQNKINSSRVAVHETVHINLITNA